MILVVIFRYVARSDSKDSARHSIMGSQHFRTVDFARQINLNMENCWGILRCIIDICMKLDQGKYLIMKDANRVSGWCELY